MRTEGVHVVFGAGQVGSYLAEALLADGRRVRVVKRSPRGVPSDAEAVFGDATDADFCKTAVVDAVAVYHCMNPAYDAAVWEQMLPPIQANLIAAAASVEARLVVLENLYMLGSPVSGVMDEDTPFKPRSRKGEIRAHLAEALLEAHERGEVSAVVGRASDFYGPRGDQTHFGERFWAPAIKGRRAEFLPNPDIVHTYHYIPDVARGLAVLGTAPDDVVGRAWMLPCAAAGTSRELIARFSEALGSNIRIRGVPRPLLGVLGLFMPILREVSEMLHQWDGAFIVDDSRFRARFEIEATSLSTGAAATVDWALAHWSAS
jgi:nucleoside-diphosphate-sugar epimerase